MFIGCHRLLLWLGLRVALCCTAARVAYDAAVVTASLNAATFAVRTFVSSHVNTAVMLITRRDEHSGDADHNDCTCVATEGGAIVVS